MQKTMVIVVVACLLLIFPVAYFVCQTTEAGIGDKVTVSQCLAAKDNYVSDSDILQRSTVLTGGANPEEGPSGDSDEGSEENPGGDQGDDSDSGDDSGGNSDGGNDTGPGGGGNDKPNVPPGDSSDEDSSEGTDNAGSFAVGVSGNPPDALVINEVHPGQENDFENRDEMVELYNMGRSPVNVSMWYMINMTGQVIGTIHDRQILPHEFLVVEVNGLKGDSQRVALFDSRNNKVDSVIYIGARSHSGLCFARMPDGSNNWEWATCTLGYSNQQGSSG